MTGEPEHVCVIAFLVGENNVQGKGIVERIQEIRKSHDQAYARWLPHVTIIPPFIIPFSDGKDKKKSSKKLQEFRETTAPGWAKGEHGLPDSENPSSSEAKVKEELERISETIEGICRNHFQTYLMLDEVSHFSLRQYDTIHLRPSESSSPGSPLLARLQRDLSIALPELSDNSRAKRSKQKQTYNPHLTLGQARTEKGSRVIYDLANGLIPNGHGINQGKTMTVQVDKIQLMVKPKSQSGPYDVYREFPLAQEPSLS